MQANRKQKYRSALTACSTPFLLRSVKCLSPASASAKMAHCIPNPCPVISRLEIIQREKQTTSSLSYAIIIYIAIWLVNKLVTIFWPLFDSQPGDGPGSVWLETSQIALAFTIKTSLVSINHEMQEQFIRFPILWILNLINLKPY